MFKIVNKFLELLVVFNILKKNPICFNYAKPQVSGHLAGLGCIVRGEGSRMEAEGATLWDHAGSGVWVGAGGSAALTACPGMACAARWLAGGARWSSRAAT